MNTPTLSIPTVADVAATLERGARIAAPLACWAIAAVLTAAQIAYQLGHGLGSAVHRRNDQLAALARRLATGERPAPVAPAPVAPAPVAPLAPVAPEVPAPVAPAPLAPLPHPLARLRDGLVALPVRELRAMAPAAPKRATRAQLAAMVLAMA